MADWTSQDQEDRDAEAKGMEAKARADAEETRASTSDAAGWTVPQVTPEERRADILKSRTAQEARQRADVGSSGMGELKRADEAASAPQEPPLSSAVMPALQSGAEAYATPTPPMPQKGPSSVSRAAGGAGVGPGQGVPPTGLVGPSPEPTAPLSGAPQTPPPPVAPRPPSMVEQLLASRERDREDLRRAQYESEVRRMGAAGLNASRAGLAMVIGHSPDAEGERLEMDAADAPVRDALARQKSDQDFQAQLSQAQEMDKRRDSDDPTAPSGVRATLLARSHGYRGEPISQNEYGQWLQGANLDELVAQRKNQAAEVAAKGAREEAQTAEDIRSHKAHEAIEWATLRDKQNKATKVPPMAEAEIQQARAKVSGLEATENFRRELVHAGANPVARNDAIRNWLPAVTAGVAPPNSSRGIAFMNDVRENQIPGWFRGVAGGQDIKNQWADAHHEDESKTLEDILDVQAGDPRVEAIRHSYANTQQRVLASRGYPEVEMHFPNGDVKKVPIKDVAKAIMLHGRITL